MRHPRAKNPQGRSLVASDFLSVARALAEEAASGIMTLFRGSEASLLKSRKEDRSLVTEADRRSDALIRDGLSKNFPDHAVLTEENGLTGSRNSEYVWIIDPLDGTKAFAKGIAGFSVMIGLLKNGSPHLGVVVDPVEGHIYEAVKGQGAFHTLHKNRTPLQVSKRNEWKDMPVVVSTGFPENLKPKYAATLTGPWCDPINSVGIKVGLVVRQVADVYISHHSVHLWDACAPQVILEEAGGVMTLKNGSPLPHNLETMRPSYSYQDWLVVSNGARHDDLLSLMQQSL
jgi:3'(2'), 5'-bisphosphate nucleotidase